MKYRNLTTDEIKKLKENGCSCFENKWEEIKVCNNFDPDKIWHVHFSGWIIIDEGVAIRNIAGGITNCHIKENAQIENVARIEFEEEAPCGVGTTVSVLDETGTRPVRIYPGISSQMATLIAREPKWFENQMGPSFQDFLDKFDVPHAIGANSIIRDCRRLINVSVGDNVKIEGANSLVNGMIINNSQSSKVVDFIDYGVDAENFIAEDAYIGANCILRNCYVGQGVSVSNAFTAHDSMFFSNCTFENGEACALLAGPYTVSMHKGTLLIGCQTSFMNAGSSTNESNHMYKLGPAHWGILERGVKTSSGAYIMFGAKIGAFSMVMGQHKTHPDSSSFPFSYLFGDERGATVIVPGAMLRSCGLMRDEKKWPARDRRIKKRIPLNDNIIFNVLNPCTVENMLTAIDTITDLLSHPADDDLFVRHKGMKFTRAALERAKSLYTVAIFKYLSYKLPELKFPNNNTEKPEDWLDLGGQIIKRTTLAQAMETENPEETEKIFNLAFENYEEDELRWIDARMDSRWRVSPEDILAEAQKFDDMVEEDRRDYLENMSRENEMLAL